LLRDGAAFAGSSRRLKKAITSSATSSLPLWNFTPWRSEKVQRFRSSLYFQLSARSGSTDRSSRMRVKPLNTRLS
jgi:hypothetical protein